MEDTKVIEIPTDKHKIEIKTWLSARDYRALDEAQVPPEMEVRLSTEDVERLKKDPSLKGKINPSEFVIKGKDAIDITKKEEDVKISVAVISINGDKEKILDKILNFKKEDFKFVLDEIDKVIAAEKKT